jgi:parallel beta-helix repeat protein
MKLRSLPSSYFLLLALISVPSVQLAQGPLTPPGAPAPTMKTLDQIEPRIPIDATHTPGDDDSIFKITQPGSYYLTDNIAGVSGKMGIEIAVAAAGPGVSIDLMGFELAGVAGSLDGISATVAGGRNFAIRNGTVRNWGGSGIDLTNNIQNALLADLRVQGNGGKGINAGTNNTITGCTAQSNGAEGIATFSGCTVSRCTANNNTGRGIGAGNACTLTECSARSNGQGGITAFGGSTVTGCAAGSNNIFGIQAGGCMVAHCAADHNGGGGIINDHGTILDCTVTENTGNGIAGGLSTLTIQGCTAYLNTADGINAPVGSSVTNCTVTSNGGDGIDASAFNITVRGCIAISNTGDGIRVGSSCRIIDNQCNNNGVGATISSGIYVASQGNHIEGNSATGNDYGINVDGTNNLIIRNSTSGNTTLNYDIVAGNKNAQVLSPGAAFVSTDPWANFAY